MIPRILHQFWVGSPLPAAYREFAEGWRRLHPGWAYRLWTDAHLPVLRNRELYDAAGRLCPGFAGQLRADVLRYELLYLFGGVWVDTDFEPRMPLDKLLEGVSCFAAWERQDNVVNNAIMGAVPGHPFLARLVEALPASVLAGKGKRRPSKVSGPHFLTAQYRAHPEGVTVFGQELFYPYRCDQLHRAGEDFPKAYAVHHWANQRRLRRRPL